MRVKSLMALLILVAAMLSPRAAMATETVREIAARPGDVRIDLALKVSFKSGRRIQMKPALVVGNDKTATTIVRSDDKSRPMEVTITVHPTAVEGGKAIHLRITVVVKAGDEQLTRTMDVTTLSGIENESVDETASEKYRLSVLAKIL